MTVAPKIAFVIDPPSGNVRVWEYGARVDPECQAHVFDQLRAGRQCYNEIVAAINTIIEQAYDWLAEQAGPQAAALSTQIANLDADWKAARARDDRDECRRVAEARYALRRERYVLIGGAKREHAAELRSRFLSRIGQRSDCETYQIRSRHVETGLDWAVANAALRSALQAFSKCWPRGRRLSFRRADDPEQSLELQFTTPGGLTVDQILSGKLRQVGIGGNGAATPATRRRYLDFHFVVGAGDHKKPVQGTVQYHRALPADGRCGFARLVTRRIGKDIRFYLQISVRTASAANAAAVAARAPLAVVHLGWMYLGDGRRIGELATTPGADATERLTLPADILDGLDRAQRVQAQRDEKRDAIAPALRELPADSAPDGLRDELHLLRKLPAQHIAPRRLARFVSAWRRAYPTFEPDALTAFESWRQDDRLLWQAAAHGARRARNRRREHYRLLAKRLTERFETILIDAPNLAKAAIVKDEETGEHTELGARARAGRVEAALYELTTAIRTAASARDAVTGRLTGATASVCAACGGTVKPFGKGYREVQCEDCGAVLDRAANAAAVGFAVASARSEELRAAILEAEEQATARVAAAGDKKLRLAQARRDARTARDGAAGQGSRDEETDATTGA